MLVKLTPEQIANNWNILRYALKEILPPYAMGALGEDSKLLEAMLIGKFQVWAEAEIVVVDGEPTSTIYAFVFTTISEHEDIGTKNLLIYGVYSVGGDLLPKQWLKGVLILVKFARAKGCKGLVAVSSNPSIISFAEKIGGDTSMTYISIPIK